MIHFEKRYDPRLELNVRVELFHPNFLKCGGRLLNISAGGVFIATHVPLEQGSVVSVKAPLPGMNRDRAIWFEALVVWTARNGAGMMFCEDNDSAFRLLKAHAVRGGRVTEAPTPSPVRVAS